MSVLHLLALQPTGPLTSLAFIGAGLVVLLVFARPSAGRLFVMLRTDTRPIGSVEPGQVEIEGTVVQAEETSSDTIATTRTGADNPVITEYRRDNGEGRDYTLPIPQQFAPDALSGQSAVPFYVEDDSGRILVDPALAEVSLDSDYTETDQVNDNTRVAAALEPGETVTVLGQAVPTEEYNQQATRRGGFLRSLYRMVRPPGNTTADTAIDETDDLVITRTSSTSQFLISDTSAGRGLLRQSLMIAFWVLSALFVIVGGMYLLISGLL